MDRPDKSSMTMEMGRSPTWLRASIQAVVAVTLLLASCQRYEITKSGEKRAVEKPPKVAKTTSAGSSEEATEAVSEVTETAPEVTSPPPKPRKPPKIVFDATHDEEIKEIFSLASRGRWEEAETRANGLIARDPQDPAAQRLLSWVQTMRRQARQKAVEDKIREIEAADNVFNPTLWDLLTENKNRGLPPRKDVRDVVSAIESRPYIPANYGKTNYLKGVMFDFESRQGRMSRVLEREISVKLDNATLATIIFDVGETEGINFVADRSLEAFKSTLSVNMKRVRLSEFLKYIQRNLGLQFQIGDDLIWIVDGKDESKRMEETRFYRLQKGFILPAQFGPDEILRTTKRQGNTITIQENQQLNNFVNDLAPKLPFIEHAITNFFQGKYMIDYERNLIIASGTRDQLDVLDRIVEELDRQIQQVLIEARFITISEPAFYRLGVAWETGRDQFTSDMIKDQTGIGFSPVALPIQETFTNILNRQNLTATLTALDQSGESQTLSAPRLTVVNNLPAKINDGKVQYYYEEYTVAQQILERRSSSTLVPKGTPTKITSGASLEVLASVGGDGRTIILALRPKVNSDVALVTFATVTDFNEAGEPVGSFDIRLPEYRTQDLSTRVVVRSGQTVVMGGVLEREQATFVEAVPILGNIPIIGAAFRRRTEVDRPRYLLVFVTATLLSETGEFLVYDEPQTGVGTSSSDLGGLFPEVN